MDKQLKIEIEKKLRMYYYKYLTPEAEKLKILLPEIHFLERQKRKSPFPVSNDIIYNTNALGEVNGYNYDQSTSGSMTIYIHKIESYLLSKQHFNVDLIDNSMIHATGMYFGAYNLYHFYAVNHKYHEIVGRQLHDVMADFAYHHDALKYATEFLRKWEEKDVPKAMGRYLFIDFAKNYVKPNSEQMRTFEKMSDTAASEILSTCERLRKRKNPGA